MSDCRLREVLVFMVAFFGLMDLKWIKWCCVRITYNV